MKMTVAMETHFVAIVHEVVDGDECLVNHHPVGVLCALYQEVCQLGDGHIWLIGACQQVYKHTHRGSLKILSCSMYPIYTLEEII